MRINLNEDQVPEEELLEDGSEVEVEAVWAEIKQDKNGKSYASLLMVVPGIPTSPDIFHMLYLPGTGETEKQEMKTQRKLLQACKAFGVDPADFNPEEDFVGQRAWAIVGIKDDAYGRNNIIRRFVKGN